MGRPRQPVYDQFMESDADRTAFTIVKLVLITVIEFAMWLLHYATYAQTMTLLPGGYLVDIPGVGWIFSAVPDMQIAHLIAGLLAMAAVATPVVIFFLIIRQRILEGPRLYFSDVTKRFSAIAIAAFWALMVVLEIANVQVLIQTHAQNPFLDNDATDAIRDHEGLAFLAAVIFALVNMAVGLGTAMAWSSVLPRKEG